MDLGAYAQIDDLEVILKENGISIPRLRGLRWMKNENAFTEKSIEMSAKRIGLMDCELACCRNFQYESNIHSFDSNTRRLEHKYLIYDEDDIATDIQWSKIHGKKRKLFKYLMKTAGKRVRNNFKTFNKYCGQEDVLYVHTRIGGNNWVYYGGPEIAKQEWFIEKVDDPFDETYCDIYVKVKKQISIQK